MGYLAEKACKSLISLFICLFISLSIYVFIFKGEAERYGFSGIDSLLRSFFNWKTLLFFTKCLDYIIYLLWPLLNLIPFLDQSLSSLNSY